jgi:hypothetical protein
MKSSKHLSHAHTGSNEEGYTITLEFVQDMIKEFKEQRVIHRRFAYEIILKVDTQLGNTWWGCLCAGQPCLHLLF